MRVIARESNALRRVSAVLAMSCTLASAALIAQQVPAVVLRPDRVWDGVADHAVSGWVVLIKGDQDASYSAIMAAMDDLRKVGIEDIGLITERKSKPATAGGK